MEPPIRCFLAIRIDAAATALLLLAQERLCKTGADVKWVETRNLHVTLKFLGAIEPGRLTDVERISRDLAAGTQRMQARLHRIGAFPSERAPKVIWAGMSFTPDAIGTLVARLDADFEPLGFAREERPFTGHVTLGRVRSPRGRKPLVEALETLRDSDFGGQAVDRVVLFRSDLSPAGPTYTALAEYPLA